MTRRAHRGHLVLLGVAVMVIVAYLAVMVRVFDVPGHDWYIGQSTTQVRRVLGLQQSGGTLTSPGGVLHLLAAQYKYFIPSVLLAGYSVRYRCPADPAMLPGTELGAGPGQCALVQLASDRDRGLWFQLAEVPAILRLDPRTGVLLLVDRDGPVELAPSLEARGDGRSFVAGLGSFVLTVPAFSVNTLAQVQQYAAARIPVDSIVVTEQSIGDLIQQRWCTVEVATPCLHDAKYAITWRTYLQ